MIRHYYLDYWLECQSIQSKNLNNLWNSNPILQLSLNIAWYEQGIKMDTHYTGPTQSNTAILSLSQYTLYSISCTSLSKYMKLGTNCDRIYIHSARLFLTSNEKKLWRHTLKTHSEQITNWTLGHYRGQCLNYLSKNYKRILLTSNICTYLTYHTNLPRNQTMNL